MSNDAVDTKHPASATSFGNDGGGVVTKGVGAPPFGNDASIGFVRVRKRKLKGGHPNIRAWLARNGWMATTSSSFDLVRSVRVAGKVRHQFVLGLGSQQNNLEPDDQTICWFWSNAIKRMNEHGLSEGQKRRLIAEMIRKGALTPTAEACKEHADNWPNRSAILQFQGLVS